MSVRAAVPNDRLPWGLRRVSERFVTGNRVELLRDGREAFPAMLDAIAAARRQILLEMYWFDSDRIGRRFAAALGDAVARGVEVAVIYDAVGSITADPGMFAELSAAGVRVLEFGPIAPWKRRFRLARLTRRDHRKILVVDGRIGFTGGLNICDLWLPEEEDGGGWRDDTVRVEGPAVEGFVRCFARTWYGEGGESLAGVTAPRRRTSSSNAGPREPSGQRVHVVGETFFRHRHAISRAYLAQLYRAEKRAWLANSYFIPDAVVVRALTRAARRGVDVRIILPGISDVPITRWASRAVWPRLLRSGVRIFEWTRGVLHSKTAVIDGRWSTIGTFNLDYLSLRRNLEVNVTVLDQTFAATLADSFERDLGGCREVSADELRYRSLGDRLLEALLYRFRKLL